jgi:archaellum biogenesis protein FlaJ (TadC family)
MLYFIIHALMHILLYFLWKYAFPRQFISFFTKNNTLTSKQLIRIVLFIAAIPFTLAAFVTVIVKASPPFELASFFITLSYLIHSKVFINHLKQEGIDVQDYFKKKENEQEE